MRKKLTLHRETLHHLEAVVGGLPPGTTVVAVQFSDQATCRQTCAFTYCRESGSCAQGCVGSVSVEL